MKMKILAAAVAILGAMAASISSAATRQIDFSFGPMSSASGTPAFGLSVGDTVSGSFQFDDSGFSGAGVYDLQPIMTSLSFTTGTKIWSLAEVTTSNDTLIVDAANVVTQWSFSLSGSGVTSGVFSNNTFNIFGPNTADFIFCNGCSSFDEVSPVPIPASLPLLVVGLGGLGYMARRKRKAA